MRELCPACPPVAVRSTSTVRSPSDAPYTAAPSPAGPAADDDEVVEVLGRARCPGRPASASSASVGSTSTLAARGDHHRAAARSSTPAAASSRSPSGSSDRYQRYGTWLRARNSRTSERARRPAVADTLVSGGGAAVRAPPRVELVVEHRVELLLRRIPRLEQVVVEVDDVDRVDRGVGVGVGGEQDAAGLRVDVHGLLEELDAVHLRHPVVGEQHRDLLAAQLHLAQRVQGLRARTRRGRSGTARRSGGAGRGRPRGTRSGRRRP